MKPSRLEIGPYGRKGSEHMMPTPLPTAVWNQLWNEIAEPTYAELLDQIHPQLHRAVLE